MEKNLHGHFVCYVYLLCFDFATKNLFKYFNTMLSIKNKFKYKKLEFKYDLKKHFAIK